MYNVTNGRVKINKVGASSQIFSTKRFFSYFLGQYNDIFLEDKRICRPSFTGLQYECV